MKVSSNTIIEKAISSYLVWILIAITSILSPLIKNKIAQLLKTLLINKSALQPYLLTLLDILIYLIIAIVFFLMGKSYHKILINKEKNYLVDYNNIKFHVFKYSNDLTFNFEAQPYCPKDKIKCTEPDNGHVYHKREHIHGYYCSFCNFTISKEDFNKYLSELRDIVHSQGFKKLKYKKHKIY